MTAYHNREEGECLVICSTCNGFLHSTSIEEARELNRSVSERNPTLMVPCPKMRAGKCAWGGTR